ncbi:MAG: DUF1800 family protein [Acidimicrobiales bacterium]
MAQTTTNEELHAHVLRRLTITAHPGQTEKNASLDPLDVAAEIIEEGYASQPKSQSLINYEENGEEAFIKDWLLDLASPEAGLRDRMAWFWHNHLTTSLNKTQLVHVVDQRRLIAEHALGNFRELLQAITVDAAMLHYLDGSYSSGDEPNENYAREVMELFALGIGNYSEEDIRVAARGLSGWYVDYETDKVVFDAEDHFSRPLRFFGTRKRWTNESIIDEICDQPECARHVSRAIYRHIVGGEPESQKLDELADVFRSNDLEIRPLLEAMVLGDDFLNHVRSRARSGIEFISAVTATLGSDSLDPEPWSLWQLGQVPYYPPNVAGWPGDARWLNASQALGRTGILFEAELSDRLIDRLEPTVDKVLNHCGLFDVSEDTRAVMDAALKKFPAYDQGLEMLLNIAISSPEYSLA